MVLTDLQIHTTACVQLRQLYFMKPGSETGRSSSLKLPFERLKQRIFVSLSGFALCVLSKLGHGGHIVLQEALRPRFPEAASPVGGK